MPAVTVCLRHLTCPRHCVCLRHLTCPLLLCLSQLSHMPSVTVSVSYTSHARCHRVCSYLTCPRHCVCLRHLTCPLSLCLSPTPHMPAVTVSVSTPHRHTAPVVLVWLPVCLSMFFSGLLSYFLSLTYILFLFAFCFSILFYGIPITRQISILTVLNPRCMADGLHCN